MVFVPTDQPNQFHTQPHLSSTARPSAAATSPSTPSLDLLHKDVEPGKTTWYRTENFFKGPNAIHFDQYESSDGTNWTKTTPEGDELLRNPS